MSDLGIIPTLLGIPFLLVGTGFTFFVLSRAVKALGSRKWPRVAAELESARLREVVTEVVRHDHAKAVVVDFSYRYQVDGRTYSGSRVTFSDYVNKTGAALKKLQRQYQTHRLIFVYYNPADPADSVLIPGASIYNFTPLLTGIGFLAAGAFLVLKL